jgi:predicted outer membrane repeat protein
MRGKTNLVTWPVCVLFVLVTVCTAAAGEVIYVDDDVEGANDGSSWSSAFTDLQDALAVAQDGDEIRVARGIYTPDRGIGIVLEDREAMFQLKDGVSILGGYAGFDEPDPDARDVELYETILTGDLAGNDGEVESPSELGPALLVDNSCRVVLADSTDETAVLDGFTITGSYPHRDLCQRARTMMIKAGNPTVRNCHFTGVGDGTQPWFSRMGGAASLLIQDAAKPIITNCRFTENQSAAVSIDSSPIFNDCIFEDNVYALELWGEDMASLYNSDGNSVIDDEVILTGCAFERTGRTGVTLVRSKITLTDCTFESTKEYSALGIRGGDVTLERCVFNNNTGYVGGAIDMADGILVASACVFTNNRSGAGGAISFTGSLDLRNCHFRENYSALEGGALASNGEQPVVASGCTFIGNTAEYGGAISYHGPSIVISNCTFADNRGVGPAIFALGGIEQNVEFSHCIIWNGQAPFQPEWWDRWVPPKVEYSDIEGGWSGIGNIDMDPFFASPGYWDPNETPDDPNDDVWVAGDYHLKSQAGRWDPTSESWIIDDVTSPCIDAGNPNSPVGFEPFPTGGIINMGAYGGTAEASKSPLGLHAKYGGGSVTAEMQTAATFLEAGWDFVDETENGIEDIWYISEGADYPELTWQHVGGVIEGD